MGSFSIWHWLVIVIMWFLIGYPGWRIVGKTGFPPALSLLFFVPVANIVMWWVLAFSTWPRDRQAG